MHIGFIGLGIMGVPMALNLSRKYPLTVWNRSPSKYSLLEQAGASIAETPAQVMKRSDIIFVMLFDSTAIKCILDDEFKRSLRGKILVNASSVEVEFSYFLADEVRRAGGDFIEMPVSGSTIPAEQGRLVGLMAGDEAVAERIRLVVQPITCAAVYCGPVGFGLKTKYAVNSYLVTMNAGLAESMNFAKAQGLDLSAFGQALAACPLASPYSKVKVKKMLAGDWSAQAPISGIYTSIQLIEAAVAGANTHSPVLHICSKLYQEANRSGLGEEDMIAVAKVIENL
ncbi:putative NAD binding NADP oxidoreductase coenzyme F420-dependent [Aspergillus steynii IBT 23096]|uniref:Putative NAD binding NADP oxidoreductase coenzyme F420-dependent n=1 Tax=Aspergillus steynii IBT 23096 TaxID=1392250 RepID=A0A2I2GA42_9EURO|nr:putative NAD binding NADP oxidoreductase coenzyme F420-dependent [Aspergillus steynii IBT 23096]PLB49738.1 putative NAD binding NADP oxidoreductase coenzyme F420-dependent [Aspergillus steynii IBT 23096]